MPKPEIRPAPPPLRRSPRRAPGRLPPAAGALPGAAWLVALVIHAGAGHAMEIEVGKSFPNLKLPTLDGGSLSIEDLRGEKVLLHVFASW